MLKKKRIFAIIMGSVMMASTLAGCGSSGTSSGSGEKITIEWETGRTDVAGTTLKKLADEYHKLNPNITVKIEAEKDSDGVLKTKAAGGELPDLSYCIGTMKKVDYPKYYEDLGDLGFTKDNLNCYDSGVQNGKLYSLNLSVTYMGVFYNKAAFKKVGITSTPKTMDEFYADCEKLKAAGITPFASNYKDGWPLDTYAGNVLAECQTGDVNFENSFLTKKPLDDPNGILYGFKFMRTMKEKGYLEKDLMSTSWDNSKKDMAQGKTAMTFLGTWFPPQLLDNGGKKEDIGMFPFPGTKAILMSANGGMCIAKTSKHKKETKEFLKWLYKDNKVQKAMALDPAVKTTKKSDIVGVSELLSSGTPVMEVKPASDKVTNIWKESEINLRQELQEYMTTSDPDKVVKEVNDKFEAARKTVGD